MNLTPYEIGILLSRTPLKIFSLPDVCIDVFLRNNLIVACEEQKFNRMQFEMTKKGKKLALYLEKSVSNWIYAPEGEVIINMETPPFSDYTTPITEDVEPEKILDDVLDMVTVSSKYAEELPCDEYGCEEEFE